MVGYYGAIPQIILPMNQVLKILPWKPGLIVSIAVLIMAIVFNFYNLYTNEFFFFKISNYIIPIVTLVHFTFLYVLWFKIKEDEIADPPMQKLEYVLYALLPIYLYKLVSTIMILATTSEFVDHALPSTYYPIALLMIGIYLLLMVLTFVAIGYRKKYVGGYNFDEINHIDSWE